MQVTVKLYASFRQGRFGIQRRDYRRGTTCLQVAQDLDLPQDGLGIVLVNGRHAALVQELEDGDIVSLLPLIGGG